MIIHNEEIISKKFSSFTEGVRVIMLINRGIMNSNKGSKRWINKIITTNSDEWVIAFKKLMQLQEYMNDPEIRLYSCLNNRKLDSAIKMFKHRQIDLLDDNKIKFYSKINDTFCSCLMKPENKLSKFFLFDIDSKCTLEVDKFISDNLINILFTYQTKNGFHYVSDPFNVKLAEGFKTFTIKKDGMILINYLGQKH